eukprot:69135-Karenia_brevis.AAC.1
MAGKKRNSTLKWRECIASMFQCDYHVVILGGLGLKEMVAEANKYIGEQYRGDASQCEDAFAFAWS